MIRPLRQRHRTIMILLAVCLPLAFAAGITLRKAPPVSQELPSALEVPPAVGKEVWMSLELWSEGIAMTRLLADASHPETHSLELTPLPGSSQPDVLVYWSAESASNLERLPDDSILLGRFVSTAPVVLLLPADVRGGGRLILYSLADQEIVRVSERLNLESGATP